MGLLSAPLGSSEPRTQPSACRALQFQVLAIRAPVACLREPCVFCPPALGGCDDHANPGNGDEVPALREPSMRPRRRLPRYAVPLSKVAARRCWVSGRPQARSDLRLHGPRNLQVARDSGQVVEIHCCHDGKVSSQLGDPIHAVD
jgi:hypothetical protein